RLWPTTKTAIPRSWLGPWPSTARWRWSRENFSRSSTCSRRLAANSMLTKQNPAAAARRWSAAILRSVTTATRTTRWGKKSTCLTVPWMLLVCCLPASISRTKRTFGFLRTPSFATTKTAGDTTTSWSGAETGRHFGAGTSANGGNRRAPGSKISRQQYERERGGRADARRHGGQLPAYALGDAGRRGRCAADRVRESREHAAGQGRGTQQRNSGSGSSRRGPRPHRA